MATPLFRVTVMIGFRMGSEWKGIATWDNDKTITQLRNTAATKPIVAPSIDIYEKGSELLKRKFIYAFALQNGLMIALGSFAQGMDLNMKLIIESSDGVREVVLF